MDRNQIMEKVDHTLLAQTATWEEIERICSQAIKYNTASVCIPPSYVKRAADYLNGKIADSGIGCSSHEHHQCHSHNE